MKYSSLVDVYEKLEKTSKRLEKTYIISQLLKKTKEDDLQTVVLLLQGKLFPVWDETKLGVSENYVIKAISVASGMPADKIKDEWRKTGDLGIVAENLIQKKKQSTLFSKDLSVGKVFKNLRKIAGVEGAGSVDQKIKLIAELLTSAKSIEAKYVVRTVLQELRVGVASGTLRDAIVWAFLFKVNYKDKAVDIEDREKYKEVVDKVQDAFNKCNDFSLVAKAAKKGLKQLDTVSLLVGKPVQVMLAQKEEDIKACFKRVGKPAALEYKYDGFRCITGHTPIYTKENGLISVKDIKKGMHVLTHKGNFKKVKALNKRTIDKNESVFKIQSWLGNEFKITQNHDVYVLRNRKKKWIPVQNVKKTDEFIFPIPNYEIENKIPPQLELEDDSGYSKKIKTDDFFFRFLGYWIGDGFTNEYHNTERVGLVFNAKKEKKLCAEYKNKIKTNFSIKNISENTHNGGLYLYFRDKPLRIWLSKNFRREWSGKHLPWWFQNITKKQFEMFLKGWIESDGYKDSRGRISITTKERDVAMVAQLTGLRNGIILAIKKIRINNKTYFKLILTKQGRHIRKSSKEYFVKILKLEQLKRPDSRLVVYNLQVETDESYCSTLLTLHNCQIHKENDKISLFTRRLEDVTKQFPEVVEYVKKYVSGKSFILDSEAVGFDAKTSKYLPFQNISQRIKRKYNIHELSQKLPVEVNVFDLIYYEGKNMLKKPLKERHNILKKMLKEQKRKIVLAKHLVTADDKKAEAFYKEALSKGFEGIMFKNLDAIYKPGSRVGYMIKLKPVMETLDLVIVGAQWGEGKRSGWLTSFVLACKKDDELAEIGKVGTGIKELEGSGITFNELTEMLKPLIKMQKGKDVTVKPKIVLEIAFEEIQKSPKYKSGYALRFPRVVRDRSMEKGPDDASSIEQVKELYVRQVKRR